jgi:methyl-accepting chemotaxis protein
VIQILRPLFGSVASAVGQQNNATNAVARNAAGTLRFAEAVSAGAADIHDAAAGADARGKSVEQHGRNVFDLAEKLKMRVTIFLRQSEAGDRRRHDRLPCEIDVELGTDSGVVRGCTADLSEGGALTRVEAALGISANAILQAKLDGIGAARVRVAGILRSDCIWNSSS